MIPLAHWFYTKYTQTPVKDVENVHVMLRRLRGNERPELSLISINKEKRRIQRSSEYVFADASTLEVLETFVENKSSFLTFKVRDSI